MIRLPPMGSEAVCVAMKLIEALASEIFDLSPNKMLKEKTTW